MGYLSGEPFVIACPDVSGAAVDAMPGLRHTYLFWSSSPGLGGEGFVDVGRPAKQVIKEIPLSAEPHRSLEFPEASSLEIGQSHR